MPGERRLGREDQRGDADEAHLVGRERARDQPTPDLARRQQVGEQGDGPEEAAAQSRQHKHRPPSLARLSTGLGTAVPEAELAAGAQQQLAEALDQAEMRAQPAAVHAAVAPGHGEETADEQQRGEHATQQDGEGDAGGVDLAALEGGDTEAPALAQDPELGFVEVEAEQVEGRGDEEQREEAGWVQRRMRWRRVACCEAALMLRVPRAD